MPSRSISQAWRSNSTCAKASNPALSNPIVCPPAPEQISMQVREDDDVEALKSLFMGSFERFLISVSR